MRHLFRKFNCFIYESLQAGSGLKFFEKIGSGRVEKSRGFVGSGLKFGFLGSSRVQNLPFMLISIENVPGGFALIILCGPIYISYTQNSMMILNKRSKL